MSQRIVLWVLGMTVLCSSLACGQKFGEWSQPTNLGQPVNDRREDWQPFVTKDGLSLYFVHGIPPNSKLLVAKRARVDEPWGEPEFLPDSVNAGGGGHPFVTPDGHWLYLNTGGTIARSWRQNKKMESGPGGWQPPVNLGLGPARMPWLHEDDETGEVILYFVSQRFGSLDLFQSTMQPDGTFGPPELVPGEGINLGDAEETPCVSHDGRELFFTSRRPGSMIGPDGQPSRDIYVATRESTHDAWSAPVPVTALNSPFHDGRPALIWKGSAIYFFSARPGNVDQFFDLWMSTREKVSASEPSE